MATDAYGMGITAKINFGRVAQITSKRLVVFSVHEPVNVKVISAYEIQSKCFHLNLNPAA